MTSWASPDRLTWLATTSAAIVLLAVILAEWARQQREAQAKERRSRSRS